MGAYNLVVFYLIVFILIFYLLLLQAEINFGTLSDTNLR